jgi:hypothetical protein
MSLFDIVSLVRFLKGLAFGRERSASKTQRNFEGVIARGKGKRNPKLTVLPPDPAIEFPHSENASLFTSWKDDAKIADPEDNPTFVMGGYKARTHPDLISILYGLSEGGVRKGYAYGRPVLARPNGLVFRIRGGTHYIFFKLREDKFDEAHKDGGRFDPSYGKDWIGFRVGGRVGSSPDWQEAIRRWARISFEDSLAIG